MYPNTIVDQSSICEQCHAHDVLILYFLSFVLSLSLSKIFYSSSSSLCAFFEHVRLWVFFSCRGWTWPCRTCERQLRDSNGKDTTPPFAQSKTRCTTSRATTTRCATMGHGQQVPLLQVQLRHRGRARHQLLHVLHHLLIPFSLFY
jgi:hypothetical protein